MKQYNINIDSNSDPFNSKVVILNGMLIQFT